MSAVRLLTVDDQPLFREATRAVVAQTPDFELVGEAADGQAAIRVAREVDPDMVIVDVRMAGMDGIESTRALTAEDPTRLVVLVSSADVRDALGPRPRRRGRRAAAQALAHAAAAARPLGRAPPALTPSLIEPGACTSCPARLGLAQRSVANRPRSVVGTLK